MSRLERLPVAWAMLPVLLLGAALRLVGLNNGSPPGLAHDEVAHWLINRSILAGQHAIYFTEAYGHEAGFHYVQAAFVALIGDNAVALRLPAAFCGLLGVAVTFVLVRQLFGRSIAFTAAALLAVLFYPVFFSRQGLRAIMLPVVAGFSGYFWWRGWGVESRDWSLETGDWRRQSGGSRVRIRRHAATSPVLDTTNLARATRHRPHTTLYIGLSGALAGLSLHTYMAARATPIFYALFMVALSVLKPKLARARWRQLALFWLALLLAAAPLLLYLFTNPGAEFRISEVDAPLRALRQGNLRPVVDNAVDILGAFGIAGDPLWRQNVASMPIFDPLVAVFFYACLALSLLYVRDIRYLFVILWLLTATIPSIVTIDAPSSIRMINILPVLTILPAIFMHNLGHLSTKIGRLSTAPVDKWGIPLLIAGLVLLNTARTARAVFVTWPANEEVRFVWQEALTDAAAFLDASSHVQDVAVGGWTPDSIDAPTMELTLRRKDLALRYFDPQQSLLVPASGVGAPAMIVHPAILPLDPALGSYLQAGGVEQGGKRSFVTYSVLHPPEPAPSVDADVMFGDEMLFLGYTPADTCSRRDGNFECTIVTVWRVQQASGAERRIFLHAINGAGELLDTGDALGTPARFWQEGDLLLQKHTLASELTAVADELRIGVYDPVNGERLLAATGEAFVTFMLNTLE